MLSTLTAGTRETVRVEETRREGRGAMGDSCCWLGAVTYRIAHRRRLFLIQSRTRTRDRARDRARAMHWYWHWHWHGDGDGDGATARSRCWGHAVLIIMSHAERPAPRVGSLEA